MNNQFDQRDKEKQFNCIDTQHRVLFVLGILWGDNGITSHLMSLGKGLISQGWEVALATSLASNSKEAHELAFSATQDFETAGIKCFSLPPSTLHLSLKSASAILSSLQTLNKAIHEFKPNIIHVHSLSMCPYMQILRLLKKTPFISSCHLQPDVNRHDVKLGKLINTYFSNTFFGERVIAISSELANTFETDIKVPKEIIRLNCYGIDQHWFRPPSVEERIEARKRLDLPLDANVVCLIGRLAPVKGHDILIQAISILKLEGIEVIAVCAGKGYGDEESVIREYAAQVDVSELIRLPGLLDARQVIWASDILTLPSRHEGFPVVIVEAMLCGVVPVRTPAAGALDQIEDGVNGFLIPFEDAEALALRLKQLLQDKDLNTKIAKATLEVAREKFTLERMVQKTVTIYDEVIKK